MMFWYVINIIYLARRSCLNYLYLQLNYLSYLEIPLLSLLPLPSSSILCSKLVWSGDIRLSYIEYPYLRTNTSTLFADLLQLVEILRLWVEILLDTFTKRSLNSAPFNKICKSRDGYSWGNFLYVEASGFKIINC